MKKILFLLLATFVLTACEDDEKQSVMPTFRGFTVTWDNPNGDSRPSAGDIIRITAVQHTPGNYIYNAKYSWEVSTVVNGQDSIFKHSNYGIVYDHQKSDPYINYIVPENNNGTLRVKFSGEYTFSSVHVAAPPTPPSHIDGYLGNFHVEYGSLFGIASGSCALYVN